MKSTIKKKRCWLVAEKQSKSVTVYIEMSSLPKLLFPKHIILSSSLSDLTEYDLKKKKEKQNSNVTLKSHLVVLYTVYSCEHSQFYIFKDLWYLLISTNSRKGMNYKSIIKCKIINVNGVTICTFSVLPIKISFE